MGSPIHLKPVRGVESGSMTLIYDALRIHKHYRRQSMTNMQAHNNKQASHWGNVITDGTQTSDTNLHPADVDAFSSGRRSSLDELSTTRLEAAKNDN